MRKASHLTLAWMAAAGALLAVASCTDEDSGPQANSPTGSATEYTAAAQALETAVPGICSNDKTVACATAADCGGSTCYLPTSGGQTLFHQVCAETAAGQHLVCTANDIGLVGVTNLQIVKGCDFPGDSAIISFVAEFGLTAQSRHDLGVWIAEDGGDALTGTCSVSNLPTAPAPPWTNLDAVDQPGDTCGDLETANNPVYASIQNITLACVDNNGDGFADPTACLTWKQHGVENGICASPLDAHPGAPSKCNCEPLRGVALPVPGVIVVDKVTNPVGDPTAFGFALTGGPNNITTSFSLTDTSAPFASSALLPGVYKVTETLPANWANELAVCTSDQGDSVTPDAINLHNGETVKCTFSNQKVVSPPSLTLAKTNDADRNGGTFADVETVPAGAVYPWTVPYRLEIKNNSSFAATLTSITDDKTATLTAPLSNATPDCASVVGTVIEGNATVTCYYEVTFANANQAQVVNTATVVATNAGGTVPTSDSSTVNFTQVGKLSLTKATDLPIYDAVGQVLTYTLVAVNTGNVTLTGVSIVDPKLGALNCTPAQPVTLAMGATLTCTGSHTVVQADLDAGSYVNTANASGQAPTGVVNSPPATATANAQAVPSLLLSKSVEPSSYDAVGQVLSYTLVATNAGNVTLSDVVIVDPKLGTLTCTPAQPAVLAPAAKLTCTGSHTVAQADLDAGSYLNTAAASAAPPLGPPIQAVPQEVLVPATQKPALTLTKEGAPPTYNAVGQVITFSIVATNTGNVTLSGVAISDPKLGALTCTPAQPVTLSPGGAITCTGSHTVTQADLDLGYFENTALAAGKAPQGQDVSAPPASEIVNAQQTPALAVVKTAQPQFYTAAGQVITYTYTVTNSGNVTLGAPIAIDDDRLGLFQCTSATTLAPAQSVTCTQQYTIVAADLNGTYDAKIINYANALAKFGPETVTSPVVQAIVSQTKPTARIAPTDVSCAMFASGAGGVLTTESYMVKNKVINSVAPGVFFYYSQLSAPVASFSVEVSQVIDGGFKPIPVQDIKQVVLYDQACVKSPARGTVTYDMATGLVSFQVTGATVGQVLYLGIKYAPTGLKGQAVPVPSPTVNYTFATALNGAPVYTSWASLAVVPKK